MSKLRFTLQTLGLLFFLLAFVSIAQAQATRTWVSGVGNDADPCSRTAPCRTWAGAQTKTATGGEIDALDPCACGAVLITKALTLDGTTGAGFGSTLFAGTNGITVNITTNLTSDKVILRNLSINGAGITLGVDGIRFLDGAELMVQNVDIFNFSGDGIEILQSQTSNVFLKNVSITHGAIGIKSTTSAGTVAGRIQNVSIDGMSSHGIQFTNNTAMLLRDVNVSRSGGTAFRADGNSSMNCESCTAFSNNIGYEALASSNTRIANSVAYHNNTGISGNVRSRGDNRFAANGANGVPAASDITVQ